MYCIFSKPCYLSFYTSHFSIIISFFNYIMFKTALFNLAKSAGVVFNLSASILSTSVFKAAKLVLLAKLLTST